NIATDVDRFFDSMQELAANPSDLVLRDQVIRRGSLLATNFNNTINQIDTIGDNVNESMLAKMRSINSKIQEVATLNDRIQTIEINGQDANTPRDRREQLARDLAVSVGAQSYYTKDGMMTIQLPGGLPLVQGKSAMELEAVTTGATLRIDLHAGGVTRTLTDHNLGGEFQGLVHVKNELIPSLKDDLDQLAYQITTRVNTQHALGAGLDGNTGRNFFADPPNIGAAPPVNPWLDAARTMQVALSKAEHIAAAADPFIGPGDNRNMLILANLDEQPAMNGVDTFNSYYGKLTAQIGLETKQNQLSVQGAKDALDQLENLRDGLSGVSLEEEMIDLIQYQR
ncbi:MAG: flagellar hook-associated protein FlgK, partial [Deltaproteobacteria bacterium]